MENDPIKQFVTVLVKEKGIDQHVDGEILADIVKNMSQQLEEYLNRSLLEGLDEKQLADFEALIDKEATIDEINDFWYKCNINVQERTARAFQRFRDAYLGTSAS